MTSRRRFVKQCRHGAMQRYLFAARYAMERQEGIERTLMALHKASKKGHQINLSKEGSRDLSAFVNLLTTRIDLLSISLSKKATRALDALTETNATLGNLPRHPALRLEDGPTQ